MSKKIKIPRAVEFRIGGVYLGYLPWAWDIVKINRFFDYVEILDIEGETSVFTLGDIRLWDLYK